MLIKNNLLIKFYLMVGILLPILFQYSTSIKGLTIGDALLVVIVIVLIINKNKIKIDKFILFFICYLFISTIVMFWGEIIEYEIILRTIRYLMYLLYIMFLPSVMEEVNYAYNFYKNICYFASVFLVVQELLLRIFNYCLPGVITVFTLTDKTLYDYRYAVYYVNSGRCMSLFAEPSHFAIYVLPMLALLMLRYENIKIKDVYGIVLILVSLFLCSSFTGILGCASIFAMWIYQNIKKGKISYSIVFLIIALMLISLYVLLKTNVGNYILNSDVFERQSKGRFAGFDYLSKFEGSFINKMFGNGMNDIGSIAYLSGWPRLVWYYGYLGTSIYIISFIHFCKKKRISTSLVILLSIMMVGTEINFSSFFVVYMIMIFVSYNFCVLDKREDKDG